MRGQAPLRLFDIVCDGELQSPPFTSFSPKQQTLDRAHVRSSPRVVIDNVAEYILAQCEKDKWDLRRDFPSLAPPFPEMWMEYRRPSRLLRSDGAISSALMPRHVGAFILAFDANPQVLAELFPAHLRGEAATARWVISLRMYFEAARLSTEDRAYVPTGLALLVAVSDDGTPLTEWSLFHVDKDRESEVSPGWEDISTFLWPMLLAISFMHCKNVRLIAEAVDPRLARARSRRGSHSPVKWEVLDIEPMKEVLRREGASAETGVRQALHICRGHFKDYRQSGLFGRVKGIFWWDAMARGSSRHGVIAKDYSVNGPDLP